MFTSKKKRESEELMQQVETTMAVFTDTVSKLKVTSDNALRAKEEKEKQINALQLEATALAGVAIKANNFIEKIENLFN